MFDSSNANSGQKKCRFITMKIICIQALLAERLNIICLKEAVLALKTHTNLFGAPNNIKKMLNLCDLKKVSCNIIFLLIIFINFFVDFCYFVEHSVWE